MRKPKITMNKPENLDAILARYNVESDDSGAWGKRFEVLFRKELTGKAERLHPAGTADCVVKRGVSVECKNGAGELNPFGFDTKEEAQEAADNDRFLLGCTHVAYLPKFNGCNLEDTFILTRKKFIKALRDFDLIRVRKGTDGKYRVAIQNYLPTRSFKPSKERAGAFLERLFDEGEYMDIFAERMFERQG